MKFHVVSALSFYGNANQIDAFHAEMFHGRAYRGGQLPTSKDARLAFDVDRPLRLHKNAFSIPHVFAPEYILVASSAVRSALNQVTHLRFAPVTFETLFSYPYRAGDFAFWDELPDYYLQQEFIDNQTDDPRLHLEVGEYFEVIAPPIRAIRDQFADLRDVSVEIGPTEFDEPLELSLSAEMLGLFPVFSCGESVMNDSVFSKLEPFIDWTYFGHAEGKL